MSVVRLTQCMIVKNEEENIRRALSWGKGIMYEQIVVDTGSTDRTIEIAEEMGAKVFHYAWKDDFSAAKNFAIDQASGNWIAFLDADEYFTEQDAAKILPLLERLEKNYPPQTRPMGIRTALVNFNDKGETGSVGAQDRIFCNRPDLRYHKRIHEVLHLTDESPVRLFDATDKMTIYHTGYTTEVYKKTKKMSRNIALLMKEVTENPEDYNAWSYLGDSYFADGRLEEAEKAYYHVIDHINEQLIEERKDLAFCNLLKIKFLSKSQQIDEIIDIYSRYIRNNGVSPDADYWVGRWMFENGELQDGISSFETALKKLEMYQKYGTLDITAALSYVYRKLFESYQELNRPSKTVKYGILSLRLDLYNEEVLKGVLELFQGEPGEKETAAATFQFLGRMYQFTSLKDKLFLIKVSKLVPFPALEKKVYEQLTLEEQEFLKKKEHSDSQWTEAELEREFPEVSCRNQMDWEFLAFIKKLQGVTEEELISEFLTAFDEMRNEYKEAGKNYIQCFKRYPQWGVFEPDEKQYDGLLKRTGFLCANLDRIVKLYQCLGDYQSKRVLLSILKSWIVLDTDSLRGVRRGRMDYYDLDLLPSGVGQVFADAQASGGEGICGYIKAYGEKYKKIYAYEAAGEKFQMLRETAGDREKLVLSQKNPALDSEKLDMLIEEAVDFLRIDGGGETMQILLGAEKHIKEDKPALLVSLCYDYKDLAEIPETVMKLNSDYKIYLRYFGGDLLPTDFMLYAV